MEKEIIRTLSYFDIFDYPITFSELKKYINYKIDISDMELYEHLENIPVIQESNGYYYFLGRQNISEKRIERSEIGAQKFVKAKFIAKILSKVPTIQFIGASGSLSMNNAADADDIDLFFITQKNTLWISRFLVNSILLLIGQKRKKFDKNPKNKICPNMFLDEEMLTFSKKKRNLYIAHEIVQVKSLFDRNDFHTRLISSNRWLSDYFPNIAIPRAKRSRTHRFSREFGMIFLPFEKLLYVLQKKFMQKNRSIETVTPGSALFHPIDRQSMILDMHDVRFKRYKKLVMENLWLDREEARFYIEEKKARILN